MSSQNIEVVRAIYDAFDRGDQDTAFELLHEDIEWSGPPDSPESRTFRGHEGVRQSLRTWVGAWDDYRYEIEKLTEVGDEVLVEGRQSGRGRNSGVEVSEEHFNVWTLQAGKAVRMRMFRDKGQALETVGLRE